MLTKQAKGGPLLHINLAWAPMFSNIYCRCRASSLTEASSNRLLSRQIQLLTSGSCRMKGRPRAAQVGPLPTIIRAAGDGNPSCAAVCPSISPHPPVAPGVDRARHVDSPLLLLQVELAAVERSKVALPLGS